MVLAILLWGFVYSAHVNHDDTNKGLSIKVTSQNFFPIFNSLLNLVVGNINRN